MAAQDLETWREWAAGVLALAAVTVAGWWKGRLIVRRDNRIDRGEQQAHDGQAKLIAQLETRVSRLTDALETVSKRLDAEIARRFDAETRALELQLRISVLEAELAEIRGDPT